MRRAILVAFCTLGLTPAASAVPIQWRVEDGGNGHYYDFVPGNIAWTQARRDAEALLHLGVPGHLTTLTSAAEKEFLRTSLPVRRSWIGGFQDTLAPDYAEPAGGWRWLTGEPWLYTNWAHPEPNEFEPGENFLEIDPAASSPDRFGWNDQQVTEVFNQGYYAEYAVQAVPEPGALSMTLLALGLLAICRRRWLPKSASRMTWSLTSLTA